jgi:hypothetical protein
VRHRENSEFWNSTSDIIKKKELLKNAKSDNRAFRGLKAGKSAYFTYPDFSAAKVKIKVGKLRW